MKVEEQINTYLTSLPELKGKDIQQLHNLICELYPTAKLWFLDGKDAANKIVANPNIGYGKHIIKYANGTFKDFYKVGITATSTGISVYFFGIDDKNYLARNYASRIGKAKFTSYCLKFKSLTDINTSVFKELLHNVFNRSN
ncbi:DUF1801 domain-containing protein [Flavobacterium sp. xlx-214]|uniref:DUF1801 domain-containing protein n=1 Tax=unclassified Flavobacterium TaxID=196869 RepID=UPI0013CFAFC3|nr:MULTISPECIES: DUF1801 domain-containing protein [unclassified Flavobacterium]MBA5791660.1 DUF1801 domain-containing protein [Flavobacterium sp. xlx-221]QMI82903.1 DUF1801 domain-containing protein [Flavobacterium sp. xlx-214]